jgi:hypothetical protein
MGIVGFSGLVVGLLGVFFFKDPSHKAFLLGIWGGYVAFGLVFPYHFLTHNYYHLPLIPVVGLSLAPAANTLFGKNRQLTRFSQIGIIGVVLLGVFVQIWEARVVLAREDYRHEPSYWQDVASMVSHEANIIALTQDYGDRITYYGWHLVENWPETAHLAYRELRGGKILEFDEWFFEETQDMDYFLVTRLKELDRQPELKNHLYETYQIFKQGDGYMYFDLNTLKE